MNFCHVCLDCEVLLCVLVWGVIVGDGKINVHLGTLVSILLCKNWCAVMLCAHLATAVEGIDSSVTCKQHLLFLLVCHSARNSTVAVIESMEGCIFCC